MAARPTAKVSSPRQRKLPLESSARVQLEAPSRVNLALARGVREIGLLLLGFVFDVVVKNDWLIRVDMPFGCIDHLR